MRWPASIHIGLRGLLLRKLRSLLSTLGIIFGVAAVVAMMAIGEGAKREALEQIKLLGTNNIRVRQVALPAELSAEAERRGSRGLSYADAEAIRQILLGVVEVAPVKLVAAEVRFEGRVGSAQVVGVGAEYGTVTDFRVVRGRFIRDADLADRRSVCVLGSEVNDELFGHRESLGASLRVGDTPCLVVGVMEPRAIREGRTLPIALRRITRDVYMPITTALQRFPDGAEPRRIDEIAVRVVSGGDVRDVARLIDAVLSPIHKGVRDYEVAVPEELVAQAQQAHRLFNVVMGSIAGISLLVGGIGIMNIMLANVSERTREIGIRRAVGATRADVMMQFLVETVLICLGGGLLGIGLGLGLATLITHYAGWETAFSPVSVLVAFGTCTAVGLLFGLFPASRAARLDPVQALRFE